ncbi:MAG: hypothetical protein QW594_02565 [Candidatus Woesearchaeota archaeon]
MKEVAEPMLAAAKSSIVLASASTRSFRQARCALLCTSIGPRMGQVPLLHSKARTPVAFLMLLLGMFFPLDMDYP